MERPSDGDQRGVLPDPVVLADYQAVIQPGAIQYSRIPVVGTVAVTVGRLVVWAGGAKRVDVSFGQPLRAAVALSIDEPGQLLLKVDAQAANPDRSGLVEFRFRTPNAAIIRDLAGPS